MRVLNCWIPLDLYPNGSFCSRIRQRLVSAASVAYVVNVVSVIR